MKINKEILIEVLIFLLTPVIFLSATCGMIGLFSWLFCFMPIVLILTASTQVDFFISLFFALSPILFFVMMIIESSIDTELVNNKYGFIWIFILVIPTFCWAIFEKIGLLF